MAMKKYSTFPKTPGLDLCHQMIVISGILVEGNLHQVLLLRIFKKQYPGNGTEQHSVVRLLLDFKIAYYDVTVQHFSYYAMGNTPVVINSLSFKTEIVNDTNLCQNVIYSLNHAIIINVFCRISKVYTYIYIYIYIKISLSSPSSSSSCCAAGMDLPDPLSSLVSIVHCSQEVFQVTSCIGTELLYIGSSWSSYLCLFM